MSNTCHIFTWCDSWQHRVLSRNCRVFVFRKAVNESALLVYNGKDNWEGMYKLVSTPHLTPFTGDSAHHPHIFSVLQFFIDHHNAFLNGDWPFINALLGLKNACAIHPCPICIIKNTSLTSAARYRTAADTYSKHTDQPPLLTIRPECIVPTPLHLFLGISNRIILDAYTELFGDSLVTAAIQKIKTVHSAGCGGLSDVFDLNGPEIRKFIKRECSSSFCSSPSTTDEKKATFSLLTRWLNQLHSCLLHSNDWLPADIDAWRGVVDDIQQHWCTETKQNAFPKLHMLRHTVEFAERHRILGRVSEAQIESFHAQFNAIFHKQHRNMSGKTAERLRRSLADAALRAVQPCVLAKQKLVDSVVLA